MRVMKKRCIVTTLILLPAIALLIFGRALLWKASGERMDVTQSTRGEFVISLLVEGTLESEDSVVVRAGKAPGELTMIVPDGTIVKKEQVFCRISASDLERSRIDAELAYKQAKEEIDRTRQSAVETYENDLRALEQVKQEMKNWEEEVRTRTEQAENQLAFDRAELDRLNTEYQRTVRMAAKGYVPAVDVEIGKAACEEQRFKVEQSDKDFELNRVQIDSERRQKLSAIAARERRVDISQSRIDGQGSWARDRAKRAEKRLQTITEALAETTIIAPETGTVTLFSTYRGGERRLWREGDQVRTGTSLGSISGNRKMIVRCRVNESNIAALHKGQQAEIAFDALPDARFGGTVSSVGLVAREVWIWEDPNANANERVFDIQVAVTQGPRQRLKAGLNGKVNIILKRLPDKLFVPLGTVFSEAGKSYVVVKQGGDFVRRQVQTGERNDVAVVINSGLTGIEQIALADPTKTAANAKKRKRW